MRAMVDLVRQDIRYAIRTFLRTPGFSLLAIATIAIGVGANAAIFTIVNAVLLQPLPFPRAGELFLVAQQNRDTRQNFGDASPANYLDWRARNRSFSGVTAFRDTTFTLASGDRPERVGGAIVNGNFFGVPAVLE